jgi:uncharacterized protein (DUF2235 family)
MKRLSIFLDGTWNDPGSETNVSKLSKLVAAHSLDGVEQKTYYDPGVGTKPFEKVLGGAIGMGLSLNVRQAYGWLLENYVDDDEVYIFGFSRGAYTARSLGGLIAGCGLAKAGAPFDVDYLYNRYQLRKDTAEPIYRLSYIRDVSRERTLTEEELTLLKDSRRIQIKMMGVWDTVGALGVPWTGMPLIGRDQFYFHNPNLSKIYENAFQALAVDEHRGAYTPTLWTLFVPDRPDGKQPPAPEMPPVKNVEQRWFIGAHANVGGGYPNDPLAKLPLAWLQSKAEALRLHFSNPVALAGDEHRTKPVDSYAKFLFHGYRLLTLGRRYYRPIGIPANKVKGGWSFPVKEYIDASVFRRCAEVNDYRPKNILEWSERVNRQLGAALGDQPAL